MALAERWGRQVGARGGHSARRYSSSRLGDSLRSSSCMLLSRMGGHSAVAAFRARSATLNHGRRLCTPGKSSPASEKVGGPSLEEKAQHAVPTATTMFRLSNPEAFMDPNKRISWVVTGVVAAGIGVMVLYALYQDYRDGAGPFARAPTESAWDPAAHSQDVLKRLPDGRLLMKDGSIQKG